MSLTSLWKSQQGELSTKHIQAMVGLAGDGKLRDGSKSSTEFREFLSNISSESISRYANECLGADKFTEASSALQDIINEVGTRLGFQVQNGLYRGKPNEIGHDGLWRSDDGTAVIVEVKTTDTYTIDLDTLADYRKNLASANKIKLEKSSILIVVGRSDTGSWEAQVRGSRHAWDIRLISVDSLLRLMRVKEDLEDPQVVSKIRQVLTPKEFTKVDEIIDLVFSAAEDVKKEEEIQQKIFSSGETEKKATPVNFRDACLERLEKYFKTVLVKRSAALYSSADGKFGVVCLNSRTFEKSGYNGYWFGFRMLQKEAIELYSNGYVAFGCGSPQTIIALPAKKLISWLNLLNVTDHEDAFYWHVHISEKERQFLLRTKEGGEAKNLTEYLLPNI